IQDPTMTKIKVTINPERNLISVYNDSSGILVEIHKEEKVYIPELIFGHLFTSSNYDDSEKKVFGWHNGYRAKLCNIFSTEFIVEMASKESGKKPPKITELEKGEDKFQMNHLNDDIVGLLKQQVYDMCAMVKGVSVFLNDCKLKLNNFKDYILWDSAKALVMAGLTKCGKLLNVRDANPAQVKDNKNLINICKIMVLNSKVDKLDTSKLWYRACSLALFDYFYPLLLTVDDFMQEFITPIDDECQLIDLAFSKKKACAHKEWLCHHKPGQRKVVYGCFLPPDAEVKVAMLTGSITEKVAYYHRDQSLASTNIDLAQNFVGANNINLLTSLGQFGSYTQGGWMQVLYVTLAPTSSPLLNCCSTKDDMPLFNCLEDDGMNVEPEFSLMEVLIILLNGCDGIIQVQPQPDNWEQAASAVKPSPKSMAKEFSLDKPESKPKASPKCKNPKVSDSEEDFEVEAALLPLPRLTLSPSCS
ncbi:DNA topoisomerase 2, partial [Massospora cicadina]